MSSKVIWLLWVQSLIETKLHFAYTSKNMTDNATGKNCTSKNFESSQLWRISSTSQFEKKIVNYHASIYSAMD